jgi:hypothetical protein
MFELTSMKSVFVFSVLLLWLLILTLSVQRVEASKYPEASESIVNPDEPSKSKNSVQNEDSVFEETGGLYTEEDFENAIPVDNTVDNTTELNQSSKIPPK